MISTACITAGEVPQVPVYVDSPLAVNATDIFKQFPQYFDDETNAFVRSGRHPALAFDQLHYIRDVEESKSLNDKKGPMLIISASGMAETGRILHHLKNNIENPQQHRPDCGLAGARYPRPPAGGTRKTGQDLWRGI